MLQLLTALGIIFAPQFLAAAMPPSADESDPVWRGYWFYLTTPGTVEKPFIGICKLAWWNKGVVNGDIRFDIEDRTDPKRHALECIVIGSNAETGKANLSLRTIVPHKDHVPTGGSELLKGTLTKHVEEGRITWSGALRVTDKNALLR